MYLVFFLLLWVRVNGSGPAGAAGPSMETHLLDPRVNGTGMVPSWVNGSGSGTTCTAPNPTHWQAYSHVSLVITSPWFKSVTKHGSFVNFHIQIQPTSASCT